MPKQNSRPTTRLTTRFTTRFTTRTRLTDRLAALIDPAAAPPRPGPGSKVDFFRLSPDDEQRLERDVF